MSKFRISVSLAIGLLCGGLALALTSSPAPRVTGPEISETDPKLENEFSAVLLLSDNPREVLRSWTTPTASVPVRTTDTVPRGVPIVAFVFFSGCQADEEGLCNASADFTILKPDGSVYERFTDRDLWKGKPAPPEGMLRLSAEFVGAIIEPGDQLGMYEFRVSLHDLNAGTTVELKAAFTATAR